MPPKSRLIFIYALVCGFFSCVSTKKYKEIQSKLSGRFDTLSAEYAKIQGTLKSCNDFSADLAKQKNEIEQSNVQKDSDLSLLRDASKRSLAELRDSLMISHSQTENIKKSLRSILAKKSASEPRNARNIQLRELVDALEVRNEILANKLTEYEAQGRSARLAYSYFKKMYRDEHKDIRVLLSIKHAERQIRDSLRQIENFQILPVELNDTSTILVINLTVYEYVKVALYDVDKDFKIDSLNIPGRQRIDTAKGNLWQWQISTNTSKRLAYLTLKVDAEKQDGKTDPFDVKEIPITISMDDATAFRRTWYALTDDPKKAIYSILVPLAGFLGYLIRGRKSKNTTSTETEKV